MSKLNFHEQALISRAVYAQGVLQGSYDYGVFRFPSVGAKNPFLIDDNAAMEEGMVEGLAVLCPEPEAIVSEYHNGIKQGAELAFIRWGM